MKFDEFKKKYEDVFGRPLSDRELAGAALERLEESEDNARDLATQLSDCEDELYELKANQRRNAGLSELGLTVSERISELIELPCDSCVITLRVSRDEIPTMDFAVNGLPIMHEEFDAEN